MRIVNIVICLLIFFNVKNISAQQLNTSYDAGEHLVYSIVYKIGFNVEVATVSMFVESDSYNNSPHNKITAIARVKPSFRWFYDLNYKYEVWVDSNTLRPSFFQNDLVEENYRCRSTYNYDWEVMKVSTWEKKYNKNTVESHLMDLTNDSYDAISMFYKFRSIDIDSLIEGKPYSLDVVFEDSIRRVYYKYLGKEIRNIKKMGKFSLLKFTCTLATSDGKPYEDGNELTLYLSDDQNRIPVYIQTPIKVGSVTAYVNYYNNLKYPLTSLNK